MKMAQKLLLYFMFNILGFLELFIRDFYDKIYHLLQKGLQCHYWWSRTFCERWIMDCFFNFFKTTISGDCGNCRFPRKYKTSIFISRNNTTLAEFLVFEILGYLLRLKSKKKIFRPLSGPPPKKIVTIFFGRVKNLNRIWRHFFPAWQQDSSLK